MRFSEFESKYPELVAGVNAGTLRTWRKRGTVPDHAFQALQRGVSKPVETAQSVSKPVSSVSRDDPFEILEDGWARGYPGDSPLMRQRYRTAHAIARRCPDRARELCERYAAAGDLPRSMQNKIPRPD